MTTCHSIKQSLIRYLADHTSVQELRDLCVVTLPIQTLDGRSVDVFIEQRMANYFLVHDGGKATSELILQGIDITASIKNSLLALAKNFGISWLDEMFQQGCKIESLQQSVMAVGACASLAMMHLLGHVQETGEQPLRNQVRDALKKWGRGHYRIGERVPVTGAITQHQFDFVAFPKSAHLPIAVSILSPGGHPLSAARSFGFKVKDIEKTESGKWKQVVFTARVEDWTPEARHIVSKCAQVVIPLPSSKKPTQALVGEHLRKLTA